MTVSDCKKALTSCQNGLKYGHFDLMQKIMRIGNSVPVTYSMEDSVSNISANLESVDQEKDLGVWCTSSLKPSVQCQKVAAKASQVLGTIRRSFKINSASMLVFLYKTYVRRQLEYRVQVWNPFLTKDIDLLEKVQRQATKCLHSLLNLSYEEWLERLDL